MREEQRAEYTRLRQLIDSGLSFASLDFTVTVRDEEESRAFNEAGILRRNIAGEQSSNEESLAALNQTLSSTQSSLTNLRNQESSLQQVISATPSQITSLTGQTSVLESSATRAQAVLDQATREYDGAVTAKNSISRNSYYYNTYRTENYQVKVKVDKVKQETLWKDICQTQSWREVFYNHNIFNGYEWDLVGSIGNLVRIMKINLDRGRPAIQSWLSKVHQVPFDCIRVNSLSFEGGLQYMQLDGCSHGYTTYRFYYSLSDTVEVKYQQEENQWRSRSVYAGQAFNQSGYDSAIRSADSRVSSKLTAKNNAESTLRAAQSALEAHNQLIRGRESDLARAPGELASVRQQISDAETRDAELRQRITEMEVQIEEGTVDLAQVESLCTEINNSVWGRLSGQIGEFNQIFSVQQELFGLMQNGTLSQIERLTEAIDSLGENIRGYCNLSGEMYQKLLSYLHEKFVNFFGGLAEEARSEIIFKIYGSEVMYKIIGIIEELGYDQQVAAELAFSGDNRALLQHLAMQEGSAQLLIKIIQSDSLELAQELVNCGANVREAYNLAVEGGDGQLQLRLRALDSNLVIENEVEDIAHQLGGLGLDGHDMGLFGADAAFADGIALS